MKNNITKHHVSEWEQAIQNRDDIEFFEVRFEKGCVSGAKGSILVKGLWRSASWRSDGRCYYHGRRASSYDIEF